MTYATSRCFGFLSGAPDGHQAPLALLSGELSTPALLREDLLQAGGLTHQQATEEAEAAWSQDGVKGRAEA